MQKYWQTSSNCNVMQLIPAIDIRKGKCVRLFQGDFTKETLYEIAPIDLAARYASAGAQWLHVVDLDGAKIGRPANLQLITDITKKIGLSIQVGGGIRTLSHLRRTLKSADRAVIGSLAVMQPNKVMNWLNMFNSDRLTLALDVRIDASGMPLLTTHGWTKSTRVSLWHLLEQYENVGLKHVLCTDVDRDGTMAGPNIRLYESCRKRWPNIELQASGGIRNKSDLAALERLKVSAAISGKALLERKILIEEMVPYLPNA